MDLSRFILKGIESLYFQLLKLYFLSFVSSSKELKDDNYFISYEELGVKFHPQRNWKSKFRNPYWDPKITVSSSKELKDDEPGLRHSLKVNINVSSSKELKVDAPSILPKEIAGMSFILKGIESRPTADRCPRIRIRVSSSKELKDICFTEDIMYITIVSSSKELKDQQGRCNKTGVHHRVHPQRDWKWRIC